MTTYSLTARQNEVLQLIQKTVEARGYPPSLREIGRHFGMVGTRAVEKHLIALEKKGVLRKGSGPRALQVTGRASGRSVPIVGRVAAGRPILAEEHRLGTLLLDPAIARDKGCFLLKVKGESMKGAAILEGDLVLVKPQPDADSGEIVVAMIEGEATVKRLIRKRGQLILQPENRAFDPITMTEKDSFQILGKVIGVFRF
jgi:repressor LexA